MPQKIPELGQLIKTARSKCRLTPPQLADRSMCSLVWIYKLEEGGIPNLRTLKVIFDVLGLQSQFEKWRVIIENTRYD